jgi:hypothetical protein
LPGENEEKRGSIRTSGMLNELRTGQKREIAVVVFNKNFMSFKTTPLDCLATLFQL